MFAPAHHRRHPVKNISPLPRKPPLCQSYNILSKRRSKFMKTSQSVSLCLKPNCTQDDLRLNVCGALSFRVFLGFFNKPDQIMEEEVNYVTVTFKTNGISTHGESCILLL